MDRINHALALSMVSADKIVAAKKKKKKKKRKEKEKERKSNEMEKT